MSEHTPGLWSVRESPTHITVTNSSGDALFHDDKHIPGVIEDAHLIAAAPENYECNKELAAIVREICACYGHPLPEASLARSDAAIAKATGPDHERN